MFHYTSHHILLNILSSNHPQALAWVSGDKEHAKLNGMVKIYAIPYDGLLIETELFQLPDAPSGSTFSFFQLRFRSTKSPSSYGSLLAMPDLPANQGYSWMTFYDTRFSLSQILKYQVLISPAYDPEHIIATGILRPLEYP